MMTWLFSGNGFIDGDDGGHGFSPRYVGTYCDNCHGTGIDPDKNDEGGLERCGFCGGSGIVQVETD